MGCWFHMCTPTSRIQPPTKEIQPEVDTRNIHSNMSGLDASAPKGFTTQTTPNFGFHLTP